MIVSQVSSVSVNATDIGVGFLLGIMWGIYGFADNRHKNPDEEIDPTKFVTTLIVFGIAGVIIAARGDPVDYDGVDALVLILAPIVDNMTNTYMSKSGPQNMEPVVTPSSRRSRRR